MRHVGVRRARKFQIEETGCRQYEELLNNPLITVIKEDAFSHLSNHFIVVHYYDLDPSRDNPDDPKEREVS